MQALPTIDVAVSGRPFRALVDTGCSGTVLSSRCVTKLGMEFSGEVSTIRMLNGVQAAAKSVKSVPVMIRGKTVFMNCLVADELVAGVDAILGMDCIEVLGGVTVMNGEVRFGRVDSDVCRAKPAVVAGGMPSETELKVCD